MFEQLLNTISKEKYSFSLLTPGGTLPAGRAYHRSININGRLYTVGGWSGTAQLADYFQYNPANNQWSLLRTGDAAESRHSNGLAYITHATDPNQNFAVSFYGASTATRNTFTRDFVNTGQVSVINFFGRSGRQEFAYGQLGNDVYIFGGWDAAGNLVNDTLRWTPPSTTLLTLSPATSPPARRGVMSVILNGQLYILGGSSDVGVTNLLNDFWRYNPINNTWMQLANFPEGIRHAAMTVVKGKIYCYGGVTTSQSTSDKIHRYDPALNKWTLLDIPNVVPRFGHTSCTIGNVIFYFGGRDEAGVFTNTLSRLQLI